MGAPSGNQFWKLRSKHGRDKMFATPELLWEAACEYFQWCDENPWTTKKAIQKTVPVKRKEGKKTRIVNEEQTQREVTPTARPYSLTGFCIYVGASSMWWRNFKEGCKNSTDDSTDDKDFLMVIARIEETIETQQFEGACVGAFNANIIARKLGLSDKQELDHTTGGKEFKGFNFLPYTKEADEVV
jgi:hypothetical protein